MFRLLLAIPPKDVAGKAFPECSVQAILLAGGPSNNALARFRAMPAVKLGQSEPSASRLHGQSKAQLPC